MKMPSDLEPDDPLLKAVLQDQDWQLVNGALKNEALRVFHSRQRIRRWTHFVGSVVVSTAIIAAVVQWLVRPVAHPRQNAAVSIPSPKQPQDSRLMSDQELLASFPIGSCFIAEVDGKKELIFVDQEVQRTYMAQTVALPFKATRE